MDNMLYCRSYMIIQIQFNDLFFGPVTYIPTNEEAAQALMVK